MLFATLGIAACCVIASPVTAANLTAELYAFDNGTGRDQKLAIQDQAELVKRTGYAGISYTGTKNLPDVLRTLDGHGLKLLSIYVHSFIRDDKVSYDPGLPAAIKQLAGRKALILLTIRGNATDGDERAVALVRSVAEMAAASGLRVCLYPHVGFFVQRVEDALRIVRKAGRKNVGVAFNLCHWLRVGDEANMTARLTEALPHLMLVSVNGADHEGEWNRLIQPLGEGDFDVFGLLRELDRLGYQGPVALQSLQLKGDLEENLKCSMAAWRGFAARLKVPAIE